MGKKLSSIVGMIAGALFLFPGLSWALHPLNFQSPQPNEVVQGNYQLIAKSIEGATAVTFLIDGGIIQFPYTSRITPGSGSENSYIAMFDTTRLTNGRHTVQFRLTNTGVPPVTGLSPIIVFFVANDYGPLYSGCTTTSNQNICTSNLEPATLSSVKGLDGWQFYARQQGTINIRAPLTWNAFLSVWIDPLSTGTSIYQRTLYSSPSGPLRLTWTPPKVLPSGSATITMAVRDANPSCGQAVPISVYAARNPYTLQTLTVPNGSIAPPTWTRTFSITANDSLIIDVGASQTPNIACEGVSFTNFSVRYVATNLAPLITKVTPSYPEIPANLEVPSSPSDVAFNWVVKDEDPASLTYRCTVDGVSLDQNDIRCRPHQDSTGAWRTSSYFNYGQHMVALSAVDRGGRISGVIAWGVNIVSLCGNGRPDTGEQCDDGGQNGASNSRCSANCQWNTALPNVHLACSQYVLSDFTGSSQARIETIQEFPTGRGIAVQLDPAVQSSMRCQGEFDIPQELNNTHYLVTVDGAGASSVWIDGVKAIGSESNNIMATRQAGVPAAPFAAGRHQIEVRLNKQWPSGTVATISPIWIYATWLPVPRDRWAGVALPLSGAAMGAVEPLPVLLSTPDANLLWDWGDGAPQGLGLSPPADFYVTFAGSFSFPAYTLQHFQIRAGAGAGHNVARLWQHAFASGQWGLQNMLSPYLTASDGIREPVIGFPSAGYRTLSGQLINYSGPAAVGVTWMREARCGDGNIDPGEQCDFDSDRGGSPSANCLADCTVPPAGGSCNGDQICQSGENAQGCQAACGATPVNLAINRDQGFGDLTQSTPVVVGGIYMPDGPEPPGNTRIIVTALDTTADPANPVARSAPFFLDDPSGLTPLRLQSDSYVREVNPGVHEISVQPPAGVSTYYSVSIGGRNHNTDTYRSGTHARFAVPAGSFASVKWVYIQSGWSYQTIYSMVRLTRTGAAGAFAASLAPPGESPLQTEKIGRHAVLRSSSKLPTAAVIQTATGASTVFPQGAITTNGAFWGRSAAPVFLTQEVDSFPVQRINLFEWPAPNAFGSGRVGCLSSCRMTSVDGNYRIICPDCNSVSFSETNFGSCDMSRAAGRPSVLAIPDIATQPWFCYVAGEPNLGVSALNFGSERLGSFFADAASGLGLSYQVTGEARPAASDGRSTISFSRAYYAPQLDQVYIDPPAALEGTTLEPLAYLRQFQVLRPDSVTMPPPYETSQVLANLQIRQMVNKEVDVVLGEPLRTFVTLNDYMKTTLDKSKQSAPGKIAFFDSAANAYGARYNCRQGECIVQQVLYGLGMNIRADQDAAGISLDSLLYLALGLELPPTTVGITREGVTGVWIGWNLSKAHPQGRQMFCGVNPGSQWCSQGTWP